MSWCWEAAESLGLSSGELLVLLHIAWRARYGSYAATHKQIAEATRIHEKSIRRHLRRLIQRGLLVEHKTFKTFGRGNIYSPVGEPWPRSGHSAWIDSPRSGHSARIDSPRSGHSARIDSPRSGHSARIRQPTFRA